MRTIIRKVEYDVEAPDGTRYWPQVVGESDGGHWAGWVEFTPIREGASMSSGTETTQSKQSDLEYWAQGLEQVFFEGALERAWRGTHAEGASVPDAADAAFLSTLTHHVEMGDLQRALVIARRVLSVIPDDPDALWVLAVAHARRQDGGAAQRCLARFLAAAPADDPRRPHAIELLAETGIGAAGS